jgi:hypothetical protein
MNWMLLRFLWITAVISILTFAPAGSVMADPGNPHGVKKEVDGVTVEMAFTAEPVKAGSSGIIVRLEGADHQPLQAAEVTVTVERHGEKDEDDHAEEESEPADSHAETKASSKDSHSDEKDDHAKEPKVVTLRAGHAPGEYEGKVSFPYAGEWDVHVSFTDGDHEKEVVFVTDVLPGDKPWLLLGSFFGVNTAVIAAAGIMRRGSNLSKKEISA